LRGGILIAWAVIIPLEAPTADDFFFLVKGLLKIYEPVAMATLFDDAAVYSERGSFASDQHE
jgi:hypothetical protein